MRSKRLAANVGCAAEKKNALEASPIDIVLQCPSGNDSAFLRLSLEDGLFSVAVRTEGGEISLVKGPIWSHTVFELETLSEGLRYVADGRLPDYIDVPSREGWIGPDVSLNPALWFQLAHPGIGKKEKRPAGRGLMMYVSRYYETLQRKYWIEIEATSNGDSAVARFEEGPILTFADEVYAAAKSLYAEREDPFES